MKQKYDFLPRKLTKEEISLAPVDWIRVLSKYPARRRKALFETKPGYNTLLAGIMAAVAKKDKNLVDVAVKLTKENVPEHIFLSLTGSALCELGSKEEGLAMLRESVKLNASPALLLGLAAETDDLEEKEKLSTQVLEQNPQDCDALSHLAFAKYAKGDHEEAERVIDKVLLIEPDNIYALENKGNSCFNRGEYTEALSHYLKITLKPVPISLQLKICHCYYLLDEVNKAKKTAEKIKDKISSAYEIEGGVKHAKELLAEILAS